MDIFPERRKPQDAVQLGDVQFDHASRRWYVLMIAPTVAREFAAHLHVVEATAEAYSYTILYFGSVRVQSNPEAQDARALVDDLTRRYVMGDVFMQFVESIDFDEVDDQGYDYVDYDNGTWEGDDRDIDEPPY